MSLVSLLCAGTGPWRRPADGDLLDIKQSTNASLIAVVVSVLGAWVALIIAEQTIYLKRQGSRYWLLWLLLVAVALGGVAVWCTQVLLSTALQTSLPSSGQALPMAYSFDVAMLCLMPSLLLTYLGLYVLMGDIGPRSNAHISSSITNSSNDTRAARATRSAQRAELELATKKRADKHAASLSTRLHLQHLRHSFTWRVVVGAFIVAVAMYVTRYQMFQIWVQPAVWDYSVAASTLAWPFDIVLMVLSCLWFFHALRTRYIGAFLFAASVIGDWFILVQSMTFRYHSAGSSLPAALLTANVSYTAISLVSGIIAAFICFVFIGLQFSRMQLSRNGLSVLAASMQANIARLEDKLSARDESITQMKQQLSAVCRMIVYIGLNTPIHTHYAYCMAQATTLEAYQSYCRLSLSSSFVRGRSNTGLAQKALADSSPVLQPRKFSNDATAEPSFTSRLILRLPSLAASPGKLASIAPLPTSTLFGRTMSITASHNANDSERSSNVRAAVEPSQLAAASSEHSLMSPAVPTRRHLRSSSTGDTVVVNRQIAAAATSPLELQPSTQQQQSLQPKSNHNRGYEEQLAALLEQSSSLDSTIAPSDLLSPVDSTSKVVNSGLAAVLVHPACEAVIKGELQARHSVENLIFYLHAQRYRQLQSARLRKTVATAMYETFIMEGAEQQININARQRDGIGFCVTKRGDDSCASCLFDEAQLEVLRLMETNMLGSKAERQCAWLMVNMPLDTLVGISLSDDMDEVAV